MDVMIAVVVTGLSVVAILALLGSGTVSHRSAAQLTSAIRLAENVHEFSMTLEHNSIPGAGINDLGDLNQSNGASRVFSPPIDSLGQPVQGTLAGWSQMVRVCDIDPTDMTNLTTLTVSSPKRIIVVVLNASGETVFTQQWILGPTLSQ